MTTDVVPQGNPEIRSLILAGVDLPSYQTTVLREAHQRLATRQRGVEMAEVQIADAERGLTAAVYADLDEQAELYEKRLRGRKMVLKRRLGQLESARKFLSLIEEGYLPIPMIQERADVRWLRDPLPPEVLETIGNEQLHERFSEFSVIGVRARWERGRRRGHRDPILVGLCDGELFPLAWWR